MSRPKDIYASITMSSVRSTLPRQRQREVLSGRSLSRLGQAFAQSDAKLTLKRIEYNYIKEEDSKIIMDYDVNITKDERKNIKLHSQTIIIKQGDKYVIDNFYKNFYDYLGAEL